MVPHLREYDRGQGAEITKANLNLQLLTNVLKVTEHKIRIYNCPFGSEYTIKH